MSSHHPSETSSAASTPRSEHHPPPPPQRWHHHPYHCDGEEEEDEPAGPRVRLMCSFGGRIVPRPHDHQLRYVGGESRILAVPRATSFVALLAKLAELLPAGAGATAMQVKYQLPHEDLDSLISVTSDEDVEIMIEEHERLSTLGGGRAARTPRLRLFLFSPSGGVGGYGSFQDRGDDLRLRRERWLLDALNSHVGAAAALERGQSEVSSVVSELPDYLFGLDNNSDQPEPVRRAPIDQPESPVHCASNFTETPVQRFSNDPLGPPVTDLHPLKIKSADMSTSPPMINREMPMDRLVQQAVPTGHPTLQTWQYMNEPGPVYYVPPAIPQQQAVPVSFPIHMSYGSQPSSHGPVPVVYQHPVQGFTSGPASAHPVYVRGLPMGPAGSVGPYGLPASVPLGYSFPTTMTHGPFGGTGAVAPVNPTAGVPSKELPDAVN